jgi:hypothetical protein
MKKSGGIKLNSTGKFAVLDLPSVSQCKFYFDKLYECLYIDQHPVREIKHVLTKKVVHELKVLVLLVEHFLSLRLHLS